MPEERDYAGESPIERPLEYTDYEIGHYDARSGALEDLENALMLPAGERKWKAEEWWHMLLGRVKDLEKNNSGRG